MQVVGQVVREHPPGYEDVVEVLSPSLCDSVRERIAFLLHLPEMKNSARKKHWRMRAGLTVGGCCSGVGGGGGGGDVTRWVQSVQLSRERSFVVPTEAVAKYLIFGKQTIL